MPKITRGSGGMRIDQRYEVVPIDSIVPHPDNPNRGDIPVIEESIRVNEWYGACVVQEATRRIMAGEHRWRAAKARGATEIPVIFRDCDDRSALRIMLVDNEAARRAVVDDEARDHILETLVSLGDEDLAGTGFSFEDLAGEADDLEDQEDTELEEDLFEPGDDSGLGTKYGVIVMVGDESEQEKLFDEMTERGWTVRCVAV